MTRFRAVVADLPWHFDDDLPGPGRGAAKHYDTVAAELSLIGMLGQALALVGGSILPDAFLFQWRVASQVELAYRVTRGWGFAPEKGEVCWKKITKHGKRHMGMGHIVRGEHEIALIATRGRPKVASKGVRSVFEAKTPERGDGSGGARHSAKPPEFFSLVETICGRGPYLELCGRSPRPGWTVVGNEIPGGFVVTPR